ncbi:hypothetical protein M9H77_10082 [Catharanthus roseus]|uniref:Uncharacterized protein n=1 Tax=Catharanthus roseus TaxID=4058 RepID=A0ACC0C2E8_CATRO|nr:hypothetical protein M9H77_10082 [Catharanthus roseus]
MNTIIFTSILLQLFLGLIFIIMGFTESDPDPLQDYCISSSQNSQHDFFFNGAPCINPSQAMASHFATSALSKPGNTQNQFGFNATLTNLVNLPGLNTLGLAMARVDIGPDGLVPPHSHPRASELTILLKGSLRVGFIDTSNRLFIAEIKSGDCFVFPKGLIHYLYNTDKDNTAVVIAGLSSQNPGVQMPSATAATIATKPELLIEVSKKIFWTNVEEIRKNILGG